MKKSVLSTLLLFTFSFSMHSFAQTQKEINQWIRNTQDKDALVRVEAIGVLGSVTTVDSISTLIKVMQVDPEFYFREKAAKSLISIGLPSIEQTIPILKHKDMEIRSLAVWVLESVTEQNFGTDGKKWENWWKKKKAELAKSSKIKSEKK